MSWELLHRLGKEVTEAEGHANRVYEAVIGLVVDNKDPDKLGRVKVRFPTLPGDDTSAWAPIAALGAGKDRGWWFLPEIDDEVLVVFEHGDIARPVVLGALWNGSDKPPEKNGGKNERSVLQSRNGSRLVFDDDAGTVTVEDGKGVGKIVLDKAGKVTLEASQGDVEIQAPAGELGVVATTIKLTASQALHFNSGGPLNMAATSTTVRAPSISASASKLDLNPPGGGAGPAKASASPKDTPDPV
jgi:phage baseplate assembly protein V